MDLIDFRSMPDGRYNWIMNVQDHYTKFCMLQPLEQKTAVGVAKVLSQLFGLFKAPQILQSDNGKEFRNGVVVSLKLLWPNLKIVHGRARNPQTQGSIERSNGDVQNVLGSWMRSNKSTSWAIGLPVVNSIKNMKHNRGN